MPFPWALILHGEPSFFSRNLFEKLAGPDQTGEARGAMLKLPFAISIPHGGTEIPSAFKPYLIASPEDLKEDVDHLTREIFSLSEEQVECTITFPYGRTFVDLNRAPTAYGDNHPDGVVKQRTHTGRPVFETFPPGETVDAVLEELYHPYHQKLSSLVTSERVRLLVDCHSMAPRDLSFSPDSEAKERPLVCLGHRGGVTAPLELVQAFQISLCQAYGLATEDISIDRPFSGGYITQTYGPGPIPVIQIEFNRKM